MVGECVVDVLKLQQFECCIYFVYFFVNVGCDDCDFVDEFKVFQVVDVLFCFCIGVNDGVVFECVENFGCMEVEN